MVTTVKQNESKSISVVTSHPIEEKPEHNNTIDIKALELIAAVSFGYQDPYRLKQWYNKLTPKYWVYSKKKKEIQEETHRLLPPSYDPVAIELQKRVEFGLTQFEAQQTEETKGVKDKFRHIIDQLDSKAMNNRLLAIGGAEMAAYASADVMSAFSNLDSNFYEGISHLAGQQIDNFSDLSQKLSSFPSATLPWQSSDFWNWGTLTDKGIDKLTGHVGEAVVADHLEKAGFNVIWPESSTQVGWDLQIDNQFFNVKIISDAASLTAHFDKYPDIAAVLPADAANIPDNAIHFDHITGQGLDAFQEVLAGDHLDHLVFVDNNLFQVDIHDQVQSASELALGGDDAFGGHIPWVTLALSGFREISFLCDGKTDFGSALMNLSLDVTGTGVGGFAGAKAGAIAGSFGGPVGAVIGGIIGGLCGALLGRSVTNSIKRADFENACKKYTEAADTLKTVAAEKQKWAEQSFNSVRTEVQTDLKSKAEIMKSEVDKSFKAIQDWIDETSIFKGEYAKQFLNRAEQDLLVVRNEINTIYSKNSFWTRRIWPNVKSLGLESALRFIDRMLFMVSLIKKDIDVGKAISRNDLTNFISTVGVCRDFVEKVLTTIYQEKVKKDEAARMAFVKAMKLMVELRISGNQIIKEGRDKIVSIVEKDLHPYATALEKLIKKIRHEGGKLGIRI